MSAPPNAGGQGFYPPPAGATYAQPPPPGYGGAPQYGGAQQPQYGVPQPQYYPQQPQQYGAPPGYMAQPPPGCSCYLPQRASAAARRCTPPSPHFASHFSPDPGAAPTVVITSSGGGGGSFGRMSTQCVCPNCHQNIMTQVTSSPSATSWLCW